MNEVQWENADNPDKEFNQDLKFIFKREKIDVKIVKRESDENVKYELFQRLNTLGSKLSDQEVRNCILVMIKPDFFQWLTSLSKYEPFNECISLAERLFEEQYHVELVLRFLILKNMNLEEIKSTQDLGEFITDRMVQLTNDQSFDRALEEIIFKRTFDILNSALGNDSFKRFNAVKNKFEGSFILSAFEAIGIALGRNYDLWENINLDATISQGIVNKVRQIWTNPDYQSRSGSGVNVTRRVPAIIPLGQSILVP